MNTQVRSERFWDGFLTGFGAAAGALLAYMAATMPAIRGMYAEFGATITLPLLTRIVTNPVTVPAITVALGTSLALLNLHRGLSPRARTTGLAVVLALALVAIVVAYVGLNAPVWELTDSIGMD
jgi:ABC-type Fe3+ transport system permease subunit